MIATDTAESVASQEFKSHPVFHSSIGVLENTPEILGVARDETTALLRLVPFSAGDQVSRDLFIYANEGSITYVNEGSIKKEDDTHFNNPGGRRGSPPALLIRSQVLRTFHRPVQRGQHRGVGVAETGQWMEPQLVSWYIPHTLTLTDRMPATEAIPAPDSDLPSVVKEFARGISGIIPTPAVVKMAARVVQTALKYTKLSHITVDDEDGDLDFDFRNGNNLIVMANFFPDGTIDASVYDDSQGTPIRVRRMQRWSETSADELVSLFEQGR